MLRRFSPAFISFAVFLALNPAFAADIETGSKLTAATVYTNRATLTRQATVEVPAGAHTVIFTGLPANLMVDSLRAEGSAKADVVFGALSSKQVIKAELTAPREKELNDQLEKLQDQRKVIMAEKQALDAQKAFLENMGRTATLRANEEIAEIDLKPEQWRAAAETIHQGIAEVLKAGLAHDVQIRDIDRKIAQVQGELNQARTGQRSTYEVSLPLEASAATTLTVNLSYQLPNASWRPLYDARLDTESGKLDLIQYGSVWQNTGEDWEDIKLTLSTAQPQRGATLPTLSPMWVNIWDTNARRKSMEMAEEAVKTGGSALPVPISRPAGVYDMAAKESRFQAAEINTGGFVSEYVIPGPSTVKADGTQSKLLIGNFKIKSEMQVHIKPQVSTEAGLVSHLTLLDESAILPGQVSLFRDGAYVGQSSLTLLRQGEDSELSFGIDDLVSVERNVMKDEKGEAGVIAKDSTIERHFKTVIENLHTRPVDVIVFETTPVAQDEKIAVEILKDVTTSGYKKDWEDTKGLLAWEKTMAAKEKFTVNLGWKVSWPKDYNIGGL